jgi:hypothetical protein
MKMRLKRIAFCNNAVKYGGVNGTEKEGLIDAP